MIYLYLALLAIPISYLFLIAVLAGGNIRKLGIWNMLWIYAGVYSLIVIPVILINYS